MLGWTTEQKIEALEAKARLLEHHLQQVAQEVGGAPGRVGQAEGEAQVLSRLEEYREFPRDRLATGGFGDRSRWTKSGGGWNRLRSTPWRSMRELIDARGQSGAGIATDKSKAEFGRQGEQEEKKRAAEAAGRSVRTRGFRERGRRSVARIAGGDGEPRRSANTVDGRVVRQSGASDAPMAARSHRRRREAAQALGRADRQGDEADFKPRIRLRRRSSTPSIRSAGEYRAMLDQLATHDLPRFEQRFKELLNAKTIDEIANFQSHSSTGAEIDHGTDRTHQRFDDPDRLQSRPLHPA